MTLLKPALQVLRDHSYSPSSLQAIKSVLIWALSPLPAIVTERLVDFFNDDPLAAAHTTQVQAQQLQLLSTLVSIHSTELDSVTGDFGDF